MYVCRCVPNPNNKKYIQRSASTLVITCSIVDKNGPLRKHIIYNSPFIVAASCRVSNCRVSNCRSDRVTVELPSEQVSSEQLSSDQLSSKQLSASNCQSEQLSGEQLTAHQCFKGPKQKGKNAFS